MDEAIANRYAQVEQLAGEIFERLLGEVSRQGFIQEELALRPPGMARYNLERDPSSNEYSLIGHWQDSRGFRSGTLLFHADGSFFVEQDIVRPHPKRKGWFVEAVNAWGRGSLIKVETRLLPMPD